MDINDENLMIKINEFDEKSRKISKDYNDSYKHSNGNILDCLYLKEPDHSRILAGILNYYSNGEPENLVSFVKMIEHKCEDISEVICFLKNSNVDTETLGRIDCLITDNNNYAIIIENKIYFAADQETQIKRYIDSVKRAGINENNIFVIYLTKDGSKKVEDYSFTDEAKKELNYKNDNENGRFIELNYKDDILPWLNDICLEIRNKDHLFIEFIDQYIDELNGEFGLREIDKGEDIKMTEELFKVLDINNKNDKEKVLELTNLKSKINNMSTAIDKAISIIIEPLFDNSFGNPMLKEFEYIEPKDNRNETYYQIFIKGFKHDFHFEWMYDRNIANIDVIEMHLHDETSEKKYKEKLIYDKDFMNMCKSNGYIEGEYKTDVIYKKINFNDKLINGIDTNVPNIVKNEYEKINEMAKYIINKYKPE